MTDKNKKVLIVEDEDSLRLVLSDALRQTGFDVLDAKNGDDGLFIALEEQPDVIVLDIQIPAMDGLTLARSLRQDHWGSKVPIIILTNQAEMESVQKAMESDVFQYFVKSDTKIARIVEEVCAMIGTPSK